MTNHTLEKHNDWWWLHLPLVITKNLSKIPATPPKVDKYLPPLKERAPEAPRVPHHTQSSRGPSNGPCTCGSVATSGGRMKARRFSVLGRVSTTSNHQKPSTTLQPTTIATTSIFCPKIIKIHNSHNNWLETKSSKIYRKKNKKLSPNPPQATTWN